MDDQVAKTDVVAQRAETPDTVHGRLLEAVHISGYTFERASDELVWILKEDRWKTVGGGFDDINLFLATINTEFRTRSVEKRQEIARLLKSIEASQRATARLLGVDESTIRADLGTKKPAAGNPAPPPEKPSKSNPEKQSDAGNPAPPAPAYFQNDKIDPIKLSKQQTKVQQKGERREERLAEIAQGNADLTTATRYPIIYADPPWRYENPPMGASIRSIENHYPTMTLEEICALPVAELATDDAVLYLWATAPKLAECMQVIVAWGFGYRTCMVWDKVHIGMGYYARNQHEILLIAKRGNIPPPLAGTQESSVLREQRGEHSAKPIFYQEMIERHYPGLPKIELFSRNPRDGWSAWGNQAGEREGDAA